MKTKFQMTDPTMSAQLATYVAAYGTHYREPLQLHRLQPMRQCMLRHLLLGMKGGAGQ